MHHKPSLTARQPSDRKLYVQLPRMAEFSVVAGFSPPEMEVAG